MEHVARDHYVSLLIAAALLAAVAACGCMPLACTASTDFNLGSFVLPVCIRYVHNCCALLLRSGCIERTTPLKLPA